MATTEIKALCTNTVGAGGNRLSPSAYAALTALLANGFQAGLAQSNQVNTALAQATFMASGLANWCVSKGVSVPDDGNVTNLVSEINAALTAFVAGAITAPTLTITPQVKTGAGYSFVTADNAFLTKRSNAGAAMADSVPGTTGAVASGWYAYIENVDAAGPIAMTVGAGGTIAIGNNATANAFVIAPGDTWLVVSSGTGNYMASRISTGLLHAKPAQGSYKRLKGVWASTTTSTFTADSVILYDAAGNSKIITAYNKTVATGTAGIGGLDTGSIAASTFYYVYAALNPSTGTQGIFMSASSTSPTLPSGYSYTALIGVLLTDGSANLVGFVQYGREWQYIPGVGSLSDYPVIAAGANGGSNVSIGAFVPVPVCSEISVLAHTLRPAEFTTVSATGNGNALCTVCNSNPNSNIFSVFTALKFQLLGSTIYYAAGGGDCLAQCYGFTINL